MKQPNILSMTPDALPAPVIIPEGIAGRGRQLTGAILATLAFAGFNGEAVQASGSPAALASAKPSCDYDNNPACFWKIRAVEPLTGDKAFRRHKWNTCVTVKRDSKEDQEATCTITKSQSKSVRAEVGGTAKVPFVDLSAAVEYAVTAATEVAVSNKAPVPRGKGYISIQYAGLYHERRRVVQEYQPCYQSSPGRYTECEPQKNPKRENLARAYTEKFKTIVLRTTRSQKPG